MAISLASINKASGLQAPRIILLGAEKVGKTTFACGSEFEGNQLKSIGNNSPIIIPIRGEEGSDGLGVDVFPTAQSYRDVQESLAVLASEDHNYKTAVLDSASAFEPLVWDEVISEAKSGEDSIEKVGGGYGKGYTEALPKWRDICDRLDYLRAAKGMASIIIGHVRIKRFDDPSGDSYDQYRMDINDKASALLFRWADCILFANTKTAVKKEDGGFGKEAARGIDVSGARYLYTQKRPAHPGGGRTLYGRLPYELPFDWVSFQRAVAQAS